MEGVRTGGEGAQKEGIMGGTRDRVKMRSSTEGQEKVREGGATGVQEGGAKVANGREEGHTSV